MNIFHNQFTFIHPLPSIFWSLVAGSAVLYTVLYFVSDSLLVSISPLLRKNCSQKSEWKDLKVRFVSTVHALVTFGLSVMMLTRDTQFQSLDVSYGSDVFSLIYSQSLGYFVYDSVVLITDLKAMGGLGMCAHHFCAVWAILQTALYKQHQSIQLLFALSEATTPFVNLRVFLVKAGKKDSFIYLMNGVAMFLGFVIFRVSLVFVIPYVFYVYREQLQQMAIFPTFMTTLGYLIISSLNVMWTYAIGMGLVKAAFAKKKSVQKKAH